MRKYDLSPLFIIVCVNNIKNENYFVKSLAMPNTNLNKFAIVTAGDSINIWQFRNV